MEAPDSSRHLFIPLTAETVEVLEARRPPLECIAAVANMAQWIDDVLREFVVDARAEGRGWHEIGEALGVSRQAAWQRHHEQDPMPSPPRGYLTSDEIWQILRTHMKPRQVYPLAELYVIVEKHRDLTPADLEPDAPGSRSARWQRNVRNVLQRRKGLGDVWWDRQAGYQLTEGHGS